MPKIPDDETLRRIREMQRLVPDQHQLDAIDQVRKMDITRMREQSEMVQKGLAGITINYHEEIAKIAADMATKFRPTFDDYFSKQFALTNPPYAFHKTLTEMAANAANVIKHFQSAPDLTAIIRSIQTANDAPLRLALETIRNWNLDARSALFSEFVDDALNQVTPLTEEKLESLEKEHLPNRKINELTKKERFDLSLLIALLGILITLYSAWKMGQPIDINPEQIAKLSQPSISITTVIRTFHEPVYYVVIRGCKLIPKPGRTNMVIYELTPPAKVQALSINHQWIYVHYEDGNMKKEGWAKKKYFKRLQNPSLNQ